MTTPFDNLKLDPEEQELSDSIERGEWVSIDKLLEKYKAFVKELKEHVQKKKAKISNNPNDPLDILAAVINVLVCDILEEIDNFESELKQVNNKKNKLIEVCSECHTAACWYGEFMCDLAKEAGTVLKTRAELGKLKLEHPEYWSDEKLLEVYGEIPDFKHKQVKDLRKT